MHEVACEFARAAVRSKDAQKQLVRTSLKQSPGTKLPQFYKISLSIWLLDFGDYNQFCDWCI